MPRPNLENIVQQLEESLQKPEILEFDRLAPLILRRIEDKVMEWKQKRLTLGLIKSSVSGVIESPKLKEFGIQDKVQCNEMHQSEYNTSGRK